MKQTIFKYVGFGTYKLKGEAGVQAIKSAIELGYTRLDTAYNYENEGTVGEAIRQASIPRHNLEITSKLPGRYHCYEDALQAISESLYRMNTPYIDTYLIHWPNPKENHYVEAWKALIEAQKRGWVKQIGVSNFLPEHIDRLYQETGIYPSVNQLECHPYFNQKDVLDYHHKHGIEIQAWSPLGRASRVLDDPQLLDLAQKYKKSVSQIILRWHVQSKVVPIPKSSSPQRQKENIDITNFELSAQDMKTIDALSHPQGRLKNQDPATYQEF